MKKKLEEEEFFKCKPGCSGAKHKIVHPEKALSGTDEYSKHYRAPPL